MRPMRTARQVHSVRSIGTPANQKESRASVEAAVPMPIQKLTQCRPKFTHQKNAASASVPYVCPAVGMRGVMRISP